MNGATAIAAGDPSVSEVVTTAPTSAIWAAVGPTPSSSPICQAIADVATAPRASATTVATPRRRRRRQATVPAMSPTTASTSTKTASSATSSSPEGEPIGSGPASVIRKSARGASPHHARPAGTPATASTRISRTEARRSARISGHPRQYAPDGGPGENDGGGLVTPPVNNGPPAGGRPASCDSPGGPVPALRDRPSQQGHAARPEQRLDVTHQGRARADAQPLVESEHRLAAAVDQLQLDLRGAGVAAQHLAQPLHEDRKST